MTVSRSDLERRFHRMEDDALLQKFQSGDLTELAQEIVGEELRRRGLALPQAWVDAGDALEERREPGDGGGLVRIAGHLSYAEAQVLKSFLESEGIPAVLADVHVATTNAILSAVTGGVRLLVHQNNLAMADEIAAAWRRGEYEIDEDFDVGAP